MSCRTSHPPLDFRRVGARGIPEISESRVCGLRGSLPLRMIGRMIQFLTAAAATDRGLVRKKNEDSFLCLPSHGVFVVADGIGGASGGDIASRAVCQHIQDAFETPVSAALVLADKVKLIREAVNTASAWLRITAKRIGVRAMGSTISALVFDPTPDAPHVIVLHAGDSRVYRLRGETLTRMTEDHSAARESGFSEDQTAPAYLQGVITRAVGIHDAVDLERTEVEVREDDLFVVCSDGLYNMIKPFEMRALLLKHRKDIEQLPAHLIEAANAAGGFDNITVAVIAVEAGG